jgi:hypothetical protein
MRANTTFGQAAEPQRSAISADLRLGKPPCFQNGQSWTLIEVCAPPHWFCAGRTREFQPRKRRAMAWSAPFGFRFLIEIDATPSMGDQGRAPPPLAVLVGHMCSSTSQRSPPLPIHAGLRIPASILNQTRRLAGIQKTDSVNLDHALTVRASSVNTRNKHRLAIGIVHAIGSGPSAFDRRLQASDCQFAHRSSG